MSLPHYVQLRSVQGLQIQIEYTTRWKQEDGNGYWLAEGVNFLVEGPPSVIKPTSTVEFVLLSRVYGEGADYSGERCWKIPGSRSDPGEGLTAFVGFIDGTITIYEETHIIWLVSKPQIAVCVDGVWQVDPAQVNPADLTWQPHNFSFEWQT